MEQRSSLNITSLFVADYQTMAPPLPQIHYTQAIWLEMGRWPLFVWTREKGERGLGGGQLGEKGDNHQVHSMPICRLVNGLILLECKAAATLTRSLSRQWRENPRLVPLKGGGSKRGLRNGPPRFVLLCLQKQTHPPFWWKPCGSGPPWGTDGDEDRKLGGTHHMHIPGHSGWKNDDKCQKTTRHWMWHEVDIECKARRASTNKFWYLLFFHGWQILS